jgi:hypothetical protein
VVVQAMPLCVLVNGWQCFAEICILHCVGGGGGGNVAGYRNGLIER